MIRSALALVVLACVSVVAFALDPLDFGDVNIGQAKQATYSFTNSGLFDCVLQAIGFGEEYMPSEGVFSVAPPPLPIELPRGATASWSIAFAPSGVGQASATLRIRMICGIFGQTLTLPLVGSGVVPSGFGDVAALLPPGVAEAGSDVGACSCGLEIAALDADVAAMAFYLQSQLGPSVSALAAAMDALETVGEQTAAPCPGPFPGFGGVKLQVFAAAAVQVTTSAAQVLPTIDPTSLSLQEVLDRGAAAVAPLLQELSELPAVAAGLSLQEQACLDTYIPQEAIDFLQAVNLAISDPLTHPKLAGLLGSTAENVIETVLEKISIWAGGIPILGNVINDIRALVKKSGDVFGLAGLMFQYELERKLDGIIYGLFGIVIPPNATESQLESLLGRISGDSLQERLGRLAEGLDAIAQGLGDLAGDIEAVDQRVRDIERVVNENAAELDDIEKKICCFVLTMREYVRQMGLALYGNGAAFEFLVPDLCRGVTEADCFGHTTTAGGEPQFDAIKPEIRQLEDDMVWVREKIEEILRRLGGGDRISIDETPPVIVPPTIRPEMTVVELEHFWLAITKKIYVYAEDTFAAASSADVHEVHVTTPAFDLSGWVDLSELRSGDEVEIEIRVNVDGRERSFQTTTFDGSVDARLVYFDELTGGRSLVVGDDIRILFRQTASADSFGTKVGIGYQFVVESQL